MTQSQEQLGRQFGPTKSLWSFDRVGWPTPGSGRVSGTSCFKQTFDRVYPAVPFSLIAVHIMSCQCMWTGTMLRSSLFQNKHRAQSLKPPPLKCTYRHNTIIIMSSRWIELFILLPPKISNTRQEEC